MSSSERYEILQDDIDQLLERIEASLDLVKKKRNQEEKRYWSNRCKSELMDAQRLIHEMEIEARAAPIQYRGEMLTKVRQFRETSARLNSELRTCQEAIQNVTKVGFDSSEQNNQNSQDEKYKQQVLQGASALEKTSQSLQRCHQVALESEVVGEAIITDLNQQREALERARSMLHETDHELTRSRRILGRLAVATIHNKIILVLIVIIQLGLIAALIYWKWFSKKSSQNIHVSSI